MVCIIIKAAYECNLKDFLHLGGYAYTAAILADMLNPNFAIAGALISLLGCANYAWNVLKGGTQPNRVGWSLWALAPLIAFAAELSQGVTLQESLITFSAGFGPILVLLASLTEKKAYWKIKPFDWYCAGLSLVALILWLITGKGDVAIVFSVCADLLAGIPTAIKSYTNPETESPIAFVAGSLGVILTLLTIQHWILANYAFPCYLLVANSTIAGIIILRGRKKSHSAKRIVKAQS